MQLSSSVFEDAAWEIDGLTEFHPGRVPTWLRDMVYESPSPNRRDDEEFVCSHLEVYSAGPGGWLYGWGEAVINGRSVFLFQTDYLTDPCCVAADWQIGITFLEPSERYSNEFFVAYFFERGRRPVSDGAVSVKPCLA